jgi:flagellum-specific ATP synthase
MIVITLLSSLPFELSNRRIGKPIYSQRMSSVSPLAALAQIASHEFYGRVTGVQGLMVEIGGISHRLSVGSRCLIATRDGGRLLAEVIGFRGGRAIALSFGGLDGVGIGCRASALSSEPTIQPHPGWLGRVVNGVGEPVDGKGPLPLGAERNLVKAPPPPAHARQRVRGKVDLGVRAINSFVTCCRGQRMGIFAGSGVGKSTLLSMMARYTAADVTVIGLVGERGREVQEFLEDDLGPDGLARSVVVVATSDEPPLMRRQAAYLTLAIAEYFRDRDQDVLCLVDSITRFAMAQREIGLSAGEPPASKGYTPSVFAELPKVLERAGPGAGKGTITGLFTVLVEGDDHNEPIADAVRGIVDGHIVLERAIAERGRYPAINVLKSISRTMPGCNSDAENEVVARARRLLAQYEDMAELIRLGAYRRGSDAAVDEAIHFQPALEQFLSQSKGERAPLEACYRALAELLDMTLA